MPKKYDKEIKMLVIKRAIEGANIKKLAEDYNIKSGSLLIKMWVKSYNEGKLGNYKLSCKGDYIMAKDIENDLLQKRVKELENKLSNVNKEISNANKEILKKDKLLFDNTVKLRYLEKHMPSCVTLNMKAENATIFLKTKKYKHEIYKKIYWAIVRNGFAITYLCQLFKVSRSKYSKWILKHNLVDPKKLFAKNSQIEFKIPEYVGKVNPKAFDLVESYFKNGPAIAAGSKSIKNWIENYYPNESPLSCKTIQNILNKHKDNFKIKRVERFKNSFSFKGKHKSIKYIREDLIKTNTKTSGIGEKIGLDGTFLNLKINNKDTRFLCEIAYDWFSRKTVAYTFSETENKEVVLDTLKKISSYLERNNLKNTIIQMDRGRANASKLVLNYEENQTSFIISMSKAGFKHNSVTESLNGWTKEQFYCTFGNRFSNLDKFYQKINEFIERKNMLQNLNYNNKKGQQLNF